jgi:nickel/cobalt transporter (NicO) family protein
MNQAWQQIHNSIKNQVRHRISNQIMNRKNTQWGLLSVLTIALCFWLAAATPSQAHWADMAAAEILVGQTDVQITLTLPTGLVAFADSDQDGSLSIAEVRQHTPELQQFLEKQIYLSDRQNHRARLTVAPFTTGAAASTTTAVPASLPTAGQIAPKSHSTLRLTYAWPQAIADFTMHYGLFLPGIPTAHCLATILHNGQLQTFMFTPTRSTFALTPALMGFGQGFGSGLWAILGAFAWGALHSLSPGHGKTLVGAYLMGERATPKHALFLATTTTITHTLGVFALGGIALFASQYILPQQLYPWLSLLSGIMVVIIGLHLLITRLRHQRIHPHHHTVPENHHNTKHTHSLDHRHSKNFDHYHSSDSDHHHSHNLYRHHLDHSNAHQHASIVAQVTQNIHPHHPHPHHSHEPPDLIANPWRGLLALGISGGIMPCPAALVLLLGAISLNQISLGLGLVFAFSLGLAGVLVVLGLGMVYAKRLFVRIPVAPQFIHVLPTASAVCITLLGLGVSAQAVMQVVGIIPGQ